jgi:hypothetical protein
MRQRLYAGRASISGFHRCRAQRHPPIAHSSTTLERQLRTGTHRPCSRTGAVARVDVVEPPLAKRPSPVANSAMEVVGLMGCAAWAPALGHLRRLARREYAVGYRVD